MLLEHLYRMSLEEPVRWAMWFGVPVDRESFLDARIDMLSSYLYGLRQAAHLLDSDASEFDAFFRWLIERGEHPTEGWPRKLLRDCGGDHIGAIGRFWGLLHEYLLQSRPPWLIRLNLSPLPSEICNGLGKTRNPDLRRPEHVTALSQRAGPGVSPADQQPDG